MAVCRMFALQIDRQKRSHQIRGVTLVGPISLADQQESRDGRRRGRRCVWCAFNFWCAAVLLRCGAVVFSGIVVVLLSCCVVDVLCSLWRTFAFVVFVYLFVVLFVLWSSCCHHPLGDCYSVVVIETSLCSCCCGGHQCCCHQKYLYRKKRRRRTMATTTRTGPYVRKNM